MIKYQFICTEIRKHGGQPGGRFTYDTFIHGSRRNTTSSRECYLRLYVFDTQILHLTNAKIWCSNMVLLQWKAHTLINGIKLADWCKVEVTWSSNKSTEFGSLAGTLNLTSLLENAWHKFLNTCAGKFVIMIDSFLPLHDWFNHEASGTQTFRVLYLPLETVVMPWTHVLEPKSCIMSKSNVITAKTPLKGLITWLVSDIISLRPSRIKSKYDIYIYIYS